MLDNLFKQDCHSSGGAWELSVPSKFGRRHISYVPSTRLYAMLAWGDWSPMGIDILVHSLWATRKMELTGRPFGT